MAKRSNCIVLHAVGLGFKFLVDIPWGAVTLLCSLTSGVKLLTLGCLFEFFFCLIFRLTARA